MTGRAPAAPPPAASLSVHELVERADALASGGRRTVLGIAGAPGAGKSTLGVTLARALGDRAALVGMDGFHFANEELDRRGIRSRKGAPDTFDVDGFASLLARLRRPQRAPIYAPVFDRARDESIGSATPVHPTTPLILVEGNYLLLETGPWRAVRRLMDEVWFLDVGPEERVRRLIRRRQAFGDSVSHSERWVRNVDEPHAELIRSTRHRADLIVELTTTVGVPAEPASCIVD
jgi:pantothenate kinase